MKIKLEVELDTELTKDEQLLNELVQLIEDIKQRLEEDE